MNIECPDCWHRWKYHGPRGANGCAAPGCGCTEHDWADEASANALAAPCEEVLAPGQQTSTTSDARDHA